MSAYLCDDQHFIQLSAYLVNDDVGSVRSIADRVGYQDYHVTHWIEEDKLASYIANTLKAQNIVSLEARYEERAEDYWPDAEEEVKVTTGDVCRSDQIPPVAILKGVDNYEYQACETSDYEQSKAAMISQMIRKEAIRRLPGYSEAEWGTPHEFGEPAPNVISLMSLVSK